MPSSAAPIWTPSAERIAKTNLVAFLAEINCRAGLDIKTYAQLHSLSVNKPDLFWSTIWDFCGVIAEARGDRTVVDIERMPGAQWFPDARLNYARNMMKRTDDAPALIALREDSVRRTVSFANLHRTVSRFQQAMRGMGIKPGDHVAGYMPNVPETICAMLAATAIGAVWACCSPELGVSAAVDRLGQIRPKLLFIGNAYLYGGKRHELIPKVAEIVRRIDAIQSVVVVPTLDEPVEPKDVRNMRTLEDFLAPYAPREVEFESLPFNHPVFILFTSGTTGAPKCIVHAAGGVLLENLKANTLQFDVKAGDITCWSCPTGWVVWNLMSTSLGCNASLVLYDGSPFHPHQGVLVEHIAQEKATFARLPARYVEIIAKAGLKPIEQYDLSALRTLMCNGSPFGADGYEYVYSHVKKDVHLVSPSGGTDSCGSLVSNNPIGPVWAGEIQGKALGFKVEIFNQDGKSVTEEAGELVLTQSFPSMPIKFLGDESSTRYHNAYFNHFPGIWRHGDWAKITEHGGIIIYGRSDSTLKAGGVRIGTAELYRLLATIPEIAESIAVGQDKDGDSRILLFIQLQPGCEFGSNLTTRIAQRIRNELSPRHVPAKIFQVEAVPLTVTGKVSEAAVQDVIHGREVRNRNALQNPETLRFYTAENIPELLT